MDIHFWCFEIKMNILSTQKVRHMINIQRIKWLYENFGMASAIKSVAYDIEAILIYIGYCLTLPFQFLWILYRGIRKGQL